jgi:hypothetical protein
MTAVITAVRKTFNEGDRRRCSGRFLVVQADLHVVRESHDV